MSTSADRPAVLYAAHYRELVRLAALLGADDPESVVQDAMVRVLRRWRGGRDVDAAGTALQQFVVRRSRHSPAQVPGAPLLTALAALPTRRREAVVLRLSARLSEAQAAHVLGSSAAAVRQLMAEAVAALQHLPDGDTEDGLIQLFQDHDVEIRADGLERIRQRLVAARRPRGLRPVAALVGLVLAGLAGTYAVAATDPGPQRAAPRPADTPDPAPSRCSGGLCVEPQPSPRLPDRVAAVSAIPGAALVAVVAGRVVLADAATGTTIQQLSEPAGGDVDSDPTRGATDGVVWVRTRADGCTSSLLRTGLAHGASGVTVDAKPLRRRLPALSDGGRTLGWVEADCAAGAPETVVVRGPDARFLTVATTSEPVTALDVRDDGAALVGLADRSYLLRPGTTTLAAAVPLQPAIGCAVVAPAWAGNAVTAWQRCAEGSHLTRFDGRGVAAAPMARASAEVQRMAVAGGFVLVVQEDGTPARVVGRALVPVPRGADLASASW